MKTVNIYSTELVKEKEVSYGQLRYPEVAQALFRDLIGNKTSEHFAVVSLSTRKEVMGFTIVAKGSNRQVPVSFAEMFRMAILQNADTIIVGHNHPSGNADPSVGDIEFTKRAIAAGKVIKIDLIDHLIVTPGGDWFSIQERHPNLFAQY